MARDTCLNLHEDLRRRLLVLGVPGLGGGTGGLTLLASTVPAVSGERRLLFVIQTRPLGGGRLRLGETLCNINNITTLSLLECSFEDIC